ncbi:MAG TPA: rhamnulokinase family protein [Thermoflexales bacterium]|jgi:rhamnulokinase|nr:rhamnulokinase family protein [Thermoflexales bacterium]HQX10383.1 rhamnulokinase family protein [Thermoflexales bacterium]HRA53503.1 rhamnulokinase family protein [Thermoflexales bacterium]
MKTVLAIDLGAESGRVVAARFDGQRLTCEEIHRFPNGPVNVRGALQWDVLRLWQEIQTGIARAARGDARIDAIGLDTWGVDFALLDRDGNLLANPTHYRDSRTQGMPEWVFERIPRERVFMQTGIQIMQINSLYQLASLVRNHSPLLETAQRLLTIPDLLTGWMTGAPVNEYTNATTTQCFDVGTGDWAWDILDGIGIPRRLFQPVTQPGRIHGAYEGIPVVLTPHHDTACAVLGVPAADANFAYLSSGTWSLLGLELPHPIITPAALAANVTNEGGYGGTVRLLKNIMGLWLLQECRRVWAGRGEETGYEALASLAEEAAPMRSLVDPDAPAFISPGDMPARLRAWCAQSGQPAPRTQGEIARCIFESLALKYRQVLDNLKALSGQRVDVLHVVGGGSRNALLCQMTADATGCVVVAGPAEATAMGNAAAQLIALGELGGVAEARALIRDSSALQTYAPRDGERWQAGLARFQALLAG